MEDYLKAETTEVPRESMQALDTAAKQVNPLVAVAVRGVHDANTTTTVGGLATVLHRSTTRTQGVVAD